MCSGPCCQYGLFFCERPQLTQLNVKVAIELMCVSVIVIHVMPAICYSACSFLSVVIQRRGVWLFLAFYHSQIRYNQ